MHRTLTAAVVAVVLAAGLAPVGPAGGWHDEADLALTRQQGSVMWVVANAVWHHNPWRCTRAAPARCVWPEGGSFYEAEVPLWSPGGWVNEHDNTLAGRVLMTQPWVFHDNPVNWPHGEPDDNGHRSRPVAVTRCPEWTDPGSGIKTEGLNCGHVDPDRLPAGWSFYDEHCNLDEHGGCVVPHRGLHDSAKTADWHVIVGVCIDQEILDDHTHNGVLDAGAARAAWAHRYRAVGRSEPLRLAHRDLRGWTQTAKDWFSGQSGTNGFLYVWNEFMTHAAIHPLTGHGIDGDDIEDWPLHVEQDGGTLDATGDGSTCTCHTDVCPSDEANGCSLPAVLPDGGTEAADYSQCLCRTGAEINQKWVESVYGVDWETDAQAFARASALAYENPRLPVRWALTGHSSPQWRVAEWSDTADHTDDWPIRWDEYGVGHPLPYAKQNHEYARNRDGNIAWEPNPRDNSRHPDSPWPWCVLGVGF